MLFCCIADDFWGCGRKVCGFITCFLIFGPACIIVAIAMFVVATKDPRGTNIAKYNTAVDMWTSGPYTTFSQLNLSFTVDDSFNTPQQMPSVTSPDEIDDSGSNIRKYNEYLRYQYRGAVLPATLSDRDESIQFTNLVTGQQTIVGVKAYQTDFDTPSTLGCTHSCSSTTYSSNCYSSVACASTCRRRDGYWDYIRDNCYYIRYLEELCVKVQADGSFDNRDQKCYGDVFGKKNPDPQGAFGGDRPIPPITVTIRSASDPFIQLYKLTDGSLWFGLTSKQYATIGVSFVVVGAFFCAFVIGVFALVFWMGHCLLCKRHSTF